MPWSIYGIFIRARQKKKQEKESPSFQSTVLVTFRLSTERNVKRLVGAAAAQVQLLKTMGLGRLTCEGHGVAVWSRPPAPSRPVESVVHLALME